MSLTIRTTTIKGAMTLRTQPDVLFWIDANNIDSYNSTPPGGSIHFVGASNQYLTVPADSRVTLGTSDFTLEFWLYQTSRGAYPTAFLYDNAASGTSPTSFFMSVGDSSSVLLSDGGNSWSLGLSWTAPSLNHWHHYALVRQGTTFTMYVDGSSVATGTSSYDIPAQNGSLQIGGANDSNVVLDGYLTNFRLIRGSAIYQSNFTPQTTPLAGGSNTTFLLRAHDAGTLLTDSSGKDFTTTNNNGATWSNKSPFGSGSVTWNDISGNGHVVTLHNGAAYDTDGISFDYTQQQYGDFAPANMFTGDFTAITWIYLRSYQSWSRVFDFGNGAGVNNIILAATGSTTGEPVYANINSSNLQANVQVPLNRWVQLVAVQEGNTGLIYMNGQLIASATNNGGTTIANRIYNYIGRSNWEQDAYLDAKIASIKIYNRSLRSSEILTDYHTNGPSTIVQSGLLLNFDAATYSGTGDWIDAANGVHATPYNTPAWSSDNGGIFTLASNNLQYFSVPWPTFQPTYTIDIWFNYTGGQPGGACLISDEFTGAPFNFTIAAAGSGIKTGWYTTNWDGQWVPNNTYTAFPNDGSTWYNIVMSVGATEYNDYLNGTLSYGPGRYGIEINGAPNGSSPTQRFFIGHRWDLPESVNAKIGVVNIYNRALTAEEVTQNFNYYRSRYGL
jgi:hypothetical protein